MEKAKNLNPLRQIRVAERYSLEDIGEAVGVTKAAVSYWEIGAFFPTDENMTKVAKFFNVDIEKFKRDFELWYNEKKL